MQLQPKQKMVINMTTYGAVLGSLAGALSTVTLIMTSSTFQFLGGTIPIMLLEILSMASFGLIFGFIFGSITGIYSGIGMSVVTSLFFKDILSKNGFKIAMGAITAICTFLFFQSGLWHLRLDGMSVTSWNMTMLMAIILAVYASQRVASFYLYEWAIRKQKAYA